MIVLLISFILAKEPIKCEYTAGDIGSITGIGEDLYQAQASAYTTCFERRTELYRRLRGEYPSEGQSIAIMESCINIKCEDNNE